MSAEMTIFTYGRDTPTLPVISLDVTLPFCLINSSILSLFVISNSIVNQSIFNCQVDCQQRYKVYNSPLKALFSSDFLNSSKSASFCSYIFSSFFVSNERLSSFFTITFCPSSGGNFILKLLKYPNPTNFCVVPFASLIILSITNFESRKYFKK